VPMTLILTEDSETGDGKRTWRAADMLDGQPASINGATQIPRTASSARSLWYRAGGLGRSSARAEQGARGRLGGCVSSGTAFAALGRVNTMPVELTEIETESKVRHRDGRTGRAGEVRVPRANLEIVQE